MRYLLLLIITIPAFEIGLFILFGKAAGVMPTIFLIILTGILGAYLAKKQGIETIRKVRLQLYNGEMPAEALLDGICILFGGLLLITPGFITDIVGFLLLVPQTRFYFKKLLEDFFRRRIRRNNVIIIR